jgi:uncharacterized protein YrrD
MEVKAGSNVMGTDGKLGQLTSVTYDTHTHTVDDLVVRHGVLLAKQHVLPMRHLVRVEGDSIYTDLDLKAFEALDVFSDYPNRLRESDPRDNPDLSPTASQAASLGMGTYVADPMPDTRQPQTDQGTPDVVPYDQRVPIIKRGTPIFDVNGEKVGEVDDFSVDTGSEMLSRVSVRRGFLLGSDTPLPPGWIADVTVKGVALRVSKDQVKQLESQA